MSLVNMIKQINGYLLKIFFFQCLQHRFYTHITTTKYPFYFAESVQGSEYQLSLYSLSLYTQFSLSLHSSKQDSWIYDKLVPKYCDSFLYLFLVTGNLPSNTGVGKRYIPLLQFFLNGPIRIVYFNLFFLASLKSFQILSAL